MNLNKKTKQLSLIFLAFAFILSFLIMSIEHLFFEQNAQKVALQNGIEKSKEREKLINDFLNSSKQDLLSIRSSKFFKEYQNNKKIKQLEDLFLIYSSAHQNFMQLRYLDKNGNELIRVQRDFETAKPYLMKSNKLQDKKDRYYFKISKEKTPEKVWFSALDLNIENKKLQKPLEPTLRAILPIYTNKKFDGLLVVNYFMKSFLENLTNAPLYDMIFFNDYGYTLYHYNKNYSDKSKCWGNSLDHKYNISNEFPNEYKKILSTDFLKTDHFVSRKLDLPIYGGINIILKLKQSYEKQQVQKSYEQYISISIIVFLISLVLTYIIIKVFSRSLLNLDKLQQLNNKLNTLKMKNDIALKASGIGIWEWDFKTNTLVWDDHLYELYGIKKTKNINPFSMWKNCVDPKDLEKTQEIINKAVDSKSDLNCSFWIITPQNERKYIKAFGVNQFDKDGKVSKMIGTNLDVTQLVLVEQKFRSLLDNASDGIHILDENGNVTMCSESFANNLLYTKEEVLKLNYQDWDIEASLKEENHINKLMNDNFVFNTIHKRKDGSTFYAQVHTKPIILENKKYLYASQRDITEQKNAEKLIDEQNKILTVQSKMTSISQLLTNIAHHWRQPLSVITTAMSAMQLKIELDKLDEDYIYKVSNKVINNAKSLSNTLDEMKKYLEGNYSINHFELDHLITELMYMEDLTLEANHIELIKNIESNIKLYNSQDGLLQSFVNIFNNSIDALKNTDGEKLIFIDAYKEDKKRLIIKIKDNAGGIIDNNITKIFDPYFTTYHQSFGKGMGLHIVYNLITNTMKGEIFVKNTSYKYNEKSYKGAEFIIKIPLDLEK